MIRFLKRLLLVLAALYVLVCVAVFAFQEVLMFHPVPLAADHDFKLDYDVQEVYVDREDGARIHGLILSQPNPRGLMLYYHGNSGNLERYSKIMDNFIGQGYAVAMMDYRGYGKSTGERSEQAMYEDADTFYAFAKARYPALPTHVYGRSLGTTFATYVSSRNYVRQLILEAPFYSMEDEAHSRYPFLPTGLLLRYTFPTYEYIDQVQAPITVVHGTEDRVVAYEHGQRLFTAIPSVDKDFITIQGAGHNGLSAYTTYWDAMARKFDFMPSEQP